MFKMSCIKLIFLVSLLPILAGCSGTEVASGSSGGSSGLINITSVEFTSRTSTCSSYVGSYYSNVTDVNNGSSFTGYLNISTSSDGSSCTFSSNGIPNHSFNDGDSSFATDVSEVSQTFTVPLGPSDASTEADLSLDVDDGVFLNGAKLDLLPAACYGVGSEPLGYEKTGCNDDDTPWRYDPMYSGNDFSTDTHNAHSQPDGAYHYHGNPLAMFDNSSPTVASPLIGYAADGYPIFGPYIDDSGSIREVVSGYTLKTGSRVSQSGEGAFPGGSYDGTFRDDYEFTNAGDLDECNGMEVDGVYGYYVTNAFPWVLNCFKGDVQSSFNK